MHGARYNMYYALCSVLCTLQAQMHRYTRTACVQVPTIADAVFVARQTPEERAYARTEQ